MTKKINCFDCLFLPEHKDLSRDEMKAVCYECVDEHYFDITDPDDDYDPGHDEFVMQEELRRGI